MADRRVVGAREASIHEALALGPALLDHARATGEIVAGATIVDDNVVVLGAHQRAGRVVRLDACERERVVVVRRATSGIAAAIRGRAIVWTLALPRVAALFPDATMRTLVNRNVRGFLKGFARAGAPAAYLGRANIAVDKQPAALLGFDVGEQGEVLFEVVAGLDAGLGVPSSIATDAELAVDAERGSLALALGAVARGDALSIAARVLESVVDVTRDDVSALAIAALASRTCLVTREHDPVPEGFELRAVRRIPIGHLDTAVSPSTGRAWLGGDALAATSILAALANGHPLPRDVALEGARPADLEDALREARSDQAAV